MRDFLEIGPCPAEEDCVQVGDDNYSTLAHEQCRMFIDLIRDKIGQEPEGADLRIKGTEHDYGMYYEVVCYYDNKKEEAVEYAFKVESSSPVRWS